MYISESDPQKAYVWIQEGRITVKKFHVLGDDCEAQGLYQGEARGY